MIEHAAEIRQEFLVMHDAAPGAETEFQPASGGVMIGTGPQRCEPLEPGEEVRIGTIAARRNDDMTASKRLSARIQAAVASNLDHQADRTGERRAGEQVVMSGRLVWAPDC